MPKCMRLCGSDDEKLNYDMQWGSLMKYNTVMEWFTGSVECVYGTLKWTVWERGGVMSVRQIQQMMLLCVKCQKTACRRCQGLRVMEKSRGGSGVWPIFKKVRFTQQLIIAIGSSHSHNDFMRQKCHSSFFISFTREKKHVCEVAFHVSEGSDDESTNKFFILPFRQLQKSALPAGLQTQDKIVSHSESLWQKYSNDGSFYYLEPWSTITHFCLGNKWQGLTLWGWSFPLELLSHLTL